MPRYGRVLHPSVKLKDLDCIYCRHLFSDYSVNDVAYVYMLPSFPNVLAWNASVMHRQRTLSSCYTMVTYPIRKLCVITRSTHLQKIDSLRENGLLRAHERFFILRLFLALRHEKAATNPFMSRFENELHNSVVDCSGYTTHNTYKHAPLKTAIRNANSDGNKVHRVLS